MNSEKCIICGLPIEDKSVEHIIPETIGGRIKINSVCGKCNKGLGDKIDCKLTDALLFQWIRKVLKIENRDGKIPTLHKYYRDSDGNKIIVKHGDGVTMPETYDGSKPPVFEIISVQGRHITAHYSGSDEASIIRSGIRAFERNGFFVKEEEMRRFIRESSEKEEGMTHVEFAITYEPMRYLPCFVKIAYETMLTLFPTYAEDPRCEEIRQFLYSSIQGNYKDDFRCDNIIHFQNSGDPVSVYNAFFSVRENWLYMDVNLFNKVVMCIPMSDDPSQFDLERYNGVNLFEQIGNQT